MDYNGSILLILVMPIVAFMYASVGHGGASSYLVILALYGFAPEQIKPTALVLNIAVAGIAFLAYRKACVFPTKLFMLLVLFSMPASFIGGTILVNILLYKKILGIILILAILRFFIKRPLSPTPVKYLWAPFIGVAIGFISGLIGIGGGIILSPLLLLLGWTNVKQTAALSALFILCNSASGLAGAIHLASFQPFLVFVLLPLAITGGAIGAYMGAQKYKTVTLKYILNVVLFFASIKLLMS